jgi:hypothetical protein
MTAEKFVVPNSIQYELLSLSQDAEIPFSGIHLDPMFVAVIKVTSMYRPWKNMLVRLQNVQTGLFCVISYFPVIHFNLMEFNSCVKLRTATFFLTNLEYSQAIEICDTFLTFPPTHKVNSGFNECFYYIEQEVHQQLRKVKTTAEIVNIMKEILPMLIMLDSLYFA